MRRKLRCRMVRKNNGVTDVLLIADPEYVNDNSHQLLVWLAVTAEDDPQVYEIGEDYFVEIRKAM